jgi:pyridoxal 5'-phosphate synthase pdxT subunit
MKTVGILALQGDFSAHAETIKTLHAKPLLIREPQQLDTVSGLIIPGGESSTMLKLIESEGFKKPLLAFGEKKPIFGTCAGAILMAKKVSNPQQYSFGWIDMEIERNSYGRQRESSIQEVQVNDSFQKQMGGSTLEAVFIRAPKIIKTNSQVEILATYQDYPVLIAQGFHLAATFHPELTSSLSIHQFFLRGI